MSRLSFSHPTVRAAFCVFLVTLPLLTAWNLFVAPFHPKLEIKIGPGLAGVTKELPLNWTLSALTDGSLQKAITSRVTEALPIRPLLVRMNNELRLEVFGELTAPGVVRGGNGQLTEQSYLTDYCSRTDGMAATRAANILPNLKTIQSFYHARGAQFVYLISPSKVAHLPDDFVTRFPCPSTPSARMNFIPAYAAQLREASINVVDTATLVHSLKSKYDVDLFPQGGVHWNELAGAESVSALVDDINRQAGRELIPSFTFTYKMATVTAGVDRDLADLLNVFFPPLAYRTPKVEFKPTVSCKNHPASELKVAIVGSSFTNLPADIMIRGNCLAQLNEFFYLKLGRFGGEPLRRLQADLSDDDLNMLRDMKVMILEENESFAGLSNYVRPLADILAKPDPSAPQ